MTEKLGEKNNYVFHYLAWVEIFRNSLEKIPKEKSFIKEASFRTFILLYGSYYKLLLDLTGEKKKFDGGIDFPRKHFIDEVSIDRERKLYLLMESFFTEISGEKGKMHAECFWPCVDFAVISEGYDVFNNANRGLRKVSSTNSFVGIIVCLFLQEIYKWMKEASEIHNFSISSELLTGYSDKTLGNLKLRLEDYKLESTDAITTVGFLVKVMENIFNFRYMGVGNKDIG